MNKYIAFYHGQRHELEAPTQYAAQLKAALHFKARKSWQVHVTLVALAGQPDQKITHLALA